MHPDRDRKKMISNKIDILTKKSCFPEPLLTLVAAALAGFAREAENRFTILCDTAGGFGS